MHSTFSPRHTLATVVLMPLSPQHQRRCASLIARRIRDWPTTFASDSLSISGEWPLSSPRPLRVLQRQSAAVERDKAVLGPAEFLPAASRSGSAPRQPA